MMEEDTVQASCMIQHNCRFLAYVVANKRTSPTNMEQLTLVVTGRLPRGAKCSIRASYQGPGAE
jgi:hypothetical protein